MAKHDFASPEREDKTFKTLVRMCRREKEMLVHMKGIGILDVQKHCEVVNE